MRLKGKNINKIQIQKDNGCIATFCTGYDHSCTGQCCLCRSSLMRHTWLNWLHYVQQSKSATPYYNDLPRSHAQLDHRLGFSAKKKYGGLLRCCGGEQLQLLRQACPHRGHVHRTAAFSAMHQPCTRTATRKTAWEPGEGTRFSICYGGPQRSRSNWVFVLLAALYAAVPLTCNLSLEHFQP
jgi:hypothetical protein